MSSNNRVIWSEGLFLRPQHFQQEQRYLERYIEQRSFALRPHSWGFTEIEYERDLLAIGKLALRRACGVFPDGTPFSMPDDDALPKPIEFSPQVRDVVIHLAVPLRRVGARDSDRQAAAAGSVRYQVRDFEARDVTSDSGVLAPLEVGGLQSRLMLASEPREDFAYIPVAHLLECRADRQVVLDERFMPTVMSSRQAPRLATFITELQGLLHQRAEALAARAVASGRGGAAEIADFLLLQSVNRYAPLLDHIAAARLVHPEDFYRQCIEILGDLSTLTAGNRRPPKLPVYNHEDLRATFEPLIAALRGCLSVVLEQNAVPIPIEKKRFNISVGVVNDKSLFENAAFVIAVRADMPADQLRKALPAQVTVAAVESIAKLVNEHVPGVPLQALSVAPRQIPYHAGFSYFELERGSPRFRELKGSGGIALHIPETFPGLAMEMWAIKG